MCPWAFVNANTVDPRSPYARLFDVTAASQSFPSFLPGVDATTLLDHARSLRPSRMSEQLLFDFDGPLAFPQRHAKGQIGAPCGREGHQ
jgi:hypothetical protein